MSACTQINIPTYYTGDDGEEPCNGLTTNQNTVNTSNNMMHHDTAFRSTVVRDIGSLKATVNNLKREVQELRSKMCMGPTGTVECNSCPMYLRLKNPTSEKLDKALLESKLSTSILGFDITRTSPRYLILLEHHLLQPSELRS